MKAKYTKTQMLLACLSGQVRGRRYMYVQPDEIFAERTRMMKRLKNFIRTAYTIDMDVTGTNAA